MKNWKRKSERLSDGMLRTAKRQVRQICKGLAGTPDQNLLDTTHDLRKRIKKLRALLRLTRDRIGNSFSKRQDRSLRAIAHTLSPMRDANVQLSIWEKLHAQFPEEISDEMFTQVLKKLSGNQASPAATPAARTQLRQELQQALKSVKKLPLRKLKKKNLRTGLKHTRKRFRNEFARAKKSATDDNLHNWRKRTKDLTHQLDILRDALSKTGSKRIERLEKLGRILGDDHDLVVLENRLRKLDPAAYKKLQTPIRTWRGRLQKEAFKVGRKV